MGQRGRDVVGVDVDELVEQLNKAYADEWLAYYQYWIGAKVLKGPMRGAVSAELVEHANEELRHADMIAERVLQLGGEPILAPEQWYDTTNCGYAAPEDEGVPAIVEQNLEGERCAIQVYDKLLGMVRGKDDVTHSMILEIQTDELEHEEDLESFLEDLEMVK